MKDGGDCLDVDNVLIVMMDGIFYLENVFELVEIFLGNGVKIVFIFFIINMIDWLINNV